MKEWKDSLRAEIAKGGDQPPCPFCGLPRLKRSDYIRCSRCAINWCAGEALDRDPRIERLNLFLESTKKTSKKPVESEHDTERSGREANSPA